MEELEMYLNFWTQLYNLTIFFTRMNQNLHYNLVIQLDQFGEKGYIFMDFDKND